MDVTQVYKQFRLLNGSALQSLKAQFQAGNPGVMAMQFTATQSCTFKWKTAQWREVYRRSYTTHVVMIEIW